MINARSETAAVKPSFRAAFRRRRCLIPADGYFEWKKTGARTKQPYYFHRNDDRPFAMAGLWEHWDGGDGPVLSCTILTTDANDLARTVHDRMPVILEPADYADWLNPQLQEKDDLQPLLCPYAGPLEAYPVRTLVNSPRNDLPECIEPIELPPGEFSPQDAP
jgi:putative SOS response-associated peptidase YedK